MPADETGASTERPLTALCTALSMPTRLQILLLLRGGERCVNALCDAFEPRMAQPTVSHHLGLLREAGLVRPRRAGKKVYYALNDPAAAAANGSGMRVVAGEYRVQFTVGGERPAGGPGNGEAETERVCVREREARATSRPVGTPRGFVGRCPSSDQASS